MYKKNRVTLLLTFLLAFSSQSHAEHYYGLAAYGDVYGFSYEHAWNTSSAYAFVGFEDYQAGLNKEDIRTRFGYRSYLDVPAWDTGWFVGAALADYGDVRKQYRPGLGFEIGKQWMRNYVRFTMSGTLGLASKRPLGSDVPEDADSKIEPIFNFGFSAMLRSEGGDQSKIERELPEDPDNTPAISPKGEKSWWKFWQGLNDL